MKTFVSELRESRSVRGIVTYEIEIRNDELHKHKVIRDKNPQVVRNKARSEATAWDAIGDNNSNKRNNLQLATEYTQKAEAEIRELEKILFRSLEVDDAVDWESLRRTEPFSEPSPTKKSISIPSLIGLPPEPAITQDRYQPRLSLYDKIASTLFGRYAEKKFLEAEELFLQEHHHWKNTVTEIDAKNHRVKENYEKALREAEENLKQVTDAWKRRREEHLTEIESANSKLEVFRDAYIAKSKSAIEDYCLMVLSNSSYPATFPKRAEVAFDDSSGVLALDYLLPIQSDLPTLREVKYVASKNTFSEKHLTDTQLAGLYEDVMYQIPLRTLHELFDSDTADAITLIVFNGWVTEINKASGHSETNCILSIQVKKEDFQKINLQAIEPKTCFRQLKGVAAVKLSTMTPIAPLIRLNRMDSRFVTSYDVANRLDSGTNLAAMDWQDFEHLIRELFQKEFCVNGGEVKVTQASRDGGVDAVAFDPDPVKGGKIVIQAKRYTNTVGVGAVRELYGTVVNEGAMKGILVTTTDYGPDAYEFAKDKPLTLMNGGNLLFLLRKHGQNAQIDIREAKKYFASQSEERSPNNRS